MKQMDLKSMIERKRSITRWKDKTNNTFDDIISKLSKIPTNMPDANYINWDVQKKFDENQVLKIGDKEIKYNVFTFCFTHVPKGYEVDDDESTQKNGFVIVYYNNGNVRYIINKNSSEALTILRRMLSYNEKNTIVSDNYLFKRDHFIWLISKIYKRDNILENGSSFSNDLKICAIRGFKGDTDGLLTTIKAEGENVIKTMSASCFLIENESLYQINVDIEYKNYKNINIILNEKSINIILDRCLILNKDECVTPDYDTVQIIEFVLRLYIEIIPIIIQNYDNDVSSELWSPKKYKEFLKQVASDLQSRVISRLTSD